MGYKNLAFGTLSKSTSEARLKESLSKALDPAILKVAGGVWEICTG
jgi:hypothetical protein